MSKWIKTNYSVDDLKTWDPYSTYDEKISEKSHMLSIHLFEHIYTPHRIYVVAVLYPAKYKNTNVSFYAPCEIYIEEDNKTIDTNYEIWESRIDKEFWEWINDKGYAIYKQKKYQIEDNKKS